MRNLRDAGWKTPAAAEWADYRLYLQPTRMLCGERIKPEKVEIYEDGSIRIDVGEEVAGSLCLTAEARGYRGNLLRRGTG